MVPSAPDVHVTARTVVDLLPRLMCHVVSREPPTSVMVPQSSSSSPERGQQLSPETTERLRGVIAERWRSLEESEEQLRLAVRDAATEARDRAVQPEALILALRKIEAEVFAHPDAIRAADQQARQRFHNWLVSACLEAYFDTKP